MINNPQNRKPSPFSTNFGTANGDRTNNHKRVRMVKTAEEKSIESKLISSPHAKRSPQQRSKDGTPVPNSQVAATIINDTAQNIIDGRNLTRLLPDIKVARLLLVSAIQSPNDLVSCALTYCNDVTDFGNTKSLLLSVIQEHFESVHKIDEVISLWLDTILFEKGAKALMVLPESNLDDLINSDLTERGTRIGIENYASKISDAGGMPSTGLLGSRPADGKANNSLSAKDILRRNKSLNLAHESLGSENGVVHLPPKNSLNQDRSFKFTSREDDKESFEVKYVMQDNADILKLNRFNEVLAREEARVRLTDQYGVKFYDEHTWADLDDDGSYGEVAQEGEGDYRNALTSARTVTESKGAADAVLNFGPGEAHGLVRQREYQWKPVQSVAARSRRNQGEPTIIDVPADCIVPVYMSGRPDEHIGLFLALEPSGNFVTVTDDTDFYREMQASKDPNNNVSGQMIQQVTDSTYGTNQNKRTTNIREEQQMLSSAVLNHNFLEALEYGAYKGIKLSLGNTDGISRLMLSRALSGDNTHFLFVPKDLVTYIAFDYNDYGCGVSLLAQNKMQGAIRAMMQFVNTQTAINNAVLHTRIDIELDEYDADPERTIEMVYHEAIRRRIASYPLGVSSPLDQLEYIAVSGTSINVANNPELPNTKVDFEYINNQVAQIDSEFTDQLKRDFLQGLGINPESIDMSMGVELAQSIVTSNILLAKRAMIYQTKFCNGLTDHLKKYAIQSPALRSELVKVIMANKDQFKGRKFYSILAKGDSQSIDIATRLVMKFLSSTYVELPKPNLNTMEMQLAAVEAKDAFYTRLVEYVISDELVTSWNMGDTVQGNTAYFRAMFKNHLMLQFIQEENIAPELFGLLGFDQENPELISLMQSSEELNNALGRFFAGHIKESAKKAEEIETIATNAGQNEVAEDSFSADSSFESGEDSFSLDDSFSTDDDGSQAFGDDPTLTEPGPEGEEL